MGRRKYFFPPLSSCFSGKTSSDLRKSDNTHDQATAAGSVDPGIVDADLIIANIATAAGSIDPENVEADLDDLSRYISQYLAFIKSGGRGQKPLQPNAAKKVWPGDRPGPNFLFKLKDVLVEGGEAVKAICPDARTIAQRSLEGLGAIHILGTGFLVLGNIMERYEQISKNRDVCLTLLKRMNTLVQHVNDLREQYGLKEGMKTQIEEAVKLIIEVSLACCTQIDKRKWIHFFSTNAIRKELEDFQTKLSELYEKISRRMGLEVIDILRNEPLRPEPSEEFIQENGVHIKKVIELLEWESDEKAVAVILYGLGGIGKTTLADAVYKRLWIDNKEAFKYSHVRLFQSITKAYEIEKLQIQILKDLKGSKIPDIRMYEVGQHAIASIFVEKEAVFIYIDNALFPEVGQGLNEVEKLLPRTTEKVKKLRLLITARDKGAAGRAFNKLRIRTKFYPIETLPDTKAMELFKKELKDGETNPVEEQINGWEERLDSSPIKQIVQICGGIPSLLMEVAKSIKSERKVTEAQEKCKAELILKEIERYVRCKAELIVKEIESYVFAHKYLYKNLTDPFFDICFYFKEWKWEELSEIVGESELKDLEDMALVTKDIESMTAKVHNAILEIGHHYRGERFKFTSGSEFQNFLNPDPKEADDQDLTKIKGIWASDISGPLDIPASKLDLMRKSLRVLALGNSTEVWGQCNGVFDELYFFSAGISHLPFVPSRLKKLRHLCYNPEDLQKLSQIPFHLRNLRVQLRLREAQLTSWTTKLKNLLPQVLGNFLNGLPRPESIRQLNRLDSLELSLTDFRELPDAFCSLSSLTKLEMDNCRRLKELPGRFGEVTRLRKLSLVGCSSLENLPDSFSQLNHLEDLNLSGCEALKKLCPEFKSLSSLKVLSLKKCKELEELPEGFHLLALLKHLDLSDCHKLKGQPMENIVKMEKLEIVEIHRSPLLQEEWQKIKVGCNQWSHKVRSGQERWQQIGVRCNEWSHKVLS